MSKHTHLTSEELAACRKQLEHKWKKRKVDVTLLENAWQTAYKISTFLYNEFRVKKVAVFGSLTEPLWFTQWSDIDMAVWGLSDEAYLQAIGKILGYDINFKIDLVKFENADILFQERIQEQAHWIYRGESFDKTSFIILESGIQYEMNSEKLTQRIQAEQIKIAQVVEHIRIALHDIEDAPDRFKGSVEIEIAKHLYDVYMGMETIFRQIAKEIDEYIPQSETWHKDLLIQMTEARVERSPVISHETAKRLEQILGFRHVFTHQYSIKIDYKQTEKNAKNIELLFEDFSKEIDIFIDSLVKFQEDD